MQYTCQGSADLTCLLISYCANYTKYVKLPCGNKISNKEIMGNWKLEQLSGNGCNLFSDFL